MFFCAHIILNPSMHVLNSFLCLKFEICFCSASALIQYVYMLTAAHIVSGALPLLQKIELMKIVDGYRCQIISKNRYLITTLSKIIKLLVSPGVDLLHIVRNISRELSTSHYTPSFKRRTNGFSILKLYF